MGRNMLGKILKGNHCTKAMEEYSRRRDEDLYIERNAPFSCVALQNIPYTAICYIFTFVHDQFTQHKTKVYESPSTNRSNPKTPWKIDNLQKLTLSCQSNDSCISNFVTIKHVEGHQKGTIFRYEYYTNICNFPDISKRQIAKTIREVKRHMHNLTQNKVNIIILSSSRRKFKVLLTTMHIPKTLRRNRNSANISDTQEITNGYSSKSFRNNTNGDVGSIQTWKETIKKRSEC